MGLVSAATNASSPATAKYGRGAAGGGRRARKQPRASTSRTDSA